MPSCSAPGCRNRSGTKGLTLFSFPKELSLRNEWVLRLKRGKWSPSQNSRLCCRHFEESQFRIIDPVIGRKKLFRGSVPSVFLHSKQELPRLTQNSYKSPSVTQTDFKRLFDHCYSYSPLSEGEKPNHSNKKISDSKDPHRNPFHPKDKDRILQINKDTPVELDRIKDLNSRLQVQMTAQREDIQHLKKKLKARDAKLRSIEEAYKCLQDSLSICFNPDQIELPCNKTSKVRVWSDQTIQRALELRSACGKNGYQMLISHGCPLPSGRTLQRNSSSKQRFITDVD
uniref:THAP domain-containing protein 6 n=1 Tax=Caligus clemensi TaxID=344056 RepID=C1C356_CALCM|nr:THAP domain-containing protein 6 [Caligus clemensi]